MKKKLNIYLFALAILSMFLIFAGDKILYILNIFTPVVYGVVFAYLMDGMVRMLINHLKLKRGWAVAIVVVFVLLLCAGLFYYAVPLLIATVKDLVNYISTLLIEHNTGMYRALVNFAEYFGIDIEALYNIDFTKIDSDLFNMINKAVKGVYGLTIGTVTKVGGSIVIICTSFIFSVYMLIEKDDLLNRMKRLVRALSSEKNEDRVLGAFTMANEVFKRFITGKFLDSLILGVIISVLFSIFRIEYGIMFGLLCGLGNMIPYFGAIITTVPVCLVLLIINPWHALIALAIIIVAQQIDNQIIQPKVLSDNIGGVSAFWILFAVAVCGIAFGLIGMIIGVPVVVIIKNLVEDFVDFRLKKRDEKKISKKEQDDEVSIKETADLGEVVNAKK